MRDGRAPTGARSLIGIEQEPGSGGKASAETSIRNLAGFSVHADRVSGDKVSRAGPFAAQAEAGNVKLLRGAWNQGYLEELCAFPLAALKDQVDATSGAFNKLHSGSLLDARGDRSLGAAGERGENRCGREPTVDEMLTPGG